MKKGYIYKGQQKYHKKNVFHNVICLENVTPDKGYFEACVLTHSKEYGNIKMKKKHFEPSDENGNPYPFQFENTYIVQKVFEKKVFWIEDNCIGKLTDSGLRFVLKHRAEFGPSIYYPKRLKGKRRKQ